MEFEKIQNKKPNPNLSVRENNHAKIIILKNFTKKLNKILFKKSH